MLVYCIENVVTRKRYIGVTTTTISVRWNAHVYRAMRGTSSKTALSCAIRKYGPESFRIEEIASLQDRTWAELCDLEKTLIRELGTKAPNGYNMTDGGDGTVGYKYTLEQRKRVTGRKWTAEQRKKILAKRKPPPAVWKGKKLSDDHRAKMRATWTPEKREAQRVRARNQIAARPRDVDGRMISTEIH